MFKGPWPCRSNHMHMLKMAPSLNDKDIAKTFLDQVGNLVHHQNLSNISLQFHQNLLIFSQTIASQKNWPLAIFQTFSKNLSDQSSFTTNLSKSGIIQVELDFFVVCFNCK